MKINISDSELPIMKVLWQNSPLTSSQILERMSGNKAIMRTMLQRLLAKKAIKAEPIDKRTYLYSPLMTQEEYTEQSSRHFLDKVFDGSSQAMMLNFIKDERVTVEELESLIEMIKEKK